MTHVVVVGAGQAGCALCAKLRAEGFDGQITLLGEEPVPPYQRPPLSKAYLMGEMELERLFLRPAAFYADHAIALRTGTRVGGINTAARTVTLSGGEVLSYDALALTTGSRPRRLPAAIGGDLAGVLVMRDLADADRMAPELVARRRVLIVGGGYIGLEAAAVCASRGMVVTVVEAAPRILQRVACAQTSDYVRAMHQSHGVTIREGTGISRLTGDGTRVTGADLADGSHIPADLVVVGVGIIPDTALAEAAGLRVENGIWTDAQARTSAPGVWAAGDCATLEFRGQRIRLESVGNAIDQAEVAALSIMGREVTYVPAPWFWSDQYDCKLQIAGLNMGYDAVHQRDAGGARSHWYYQGDSLIAVDAMNDSRAYMIGKRLIEAGKSPAPAIVTDPATDLKALLKA
jgi:3-phenylpropionate/trans-cinnamate dioxygenase ferredoxin reductase subunit